MDPEAPNVLHSLSQSAAWSRANEKGVFPGVSTVLNWSIWGEIGERGTRRAAFELGLFSAAELEPPESVDEWMWSIFYGRPTANVDSWRGLYERGLAASGAGGEAQRQVFGHTASNVPEDAPPDRRAEVAARRPAALVKAAERMRAARADTERWWREATRASALTDPERSRRDFATALEFFERADPNHILVSLFATEAVTELSAAAEQAGRPEAANALMVGYPGMEEFETTAALWELSRGRASLETFLGRHGFHGAEEGEIASHSWREASDSIAKLAERYAALDETENPAALETRSIQKRSATGAELRAALPAEARGAFDDTLERTATFLPLREAGRATLTLALDAMRAHARVIGHDLEMRGALPAANDVFLLTRQEVLDLPPDALERIEERRQLRAHYASFELPEAWQGMPIKQALPERMAQEIHSESVPARPVGTRLKGLGASSGVHEGVARVVLDARALAEEFEAGDILVAPATDPSWAPFFLVAGAVVIDTGSNISHAAVVAREMDIPAVVGLKGASETLHTGQRLRVNGSAGTVEIVG
jgi:pyruvate,water dikinase